LLLVVVDVGMLKTGVLNAFAGLSLLAESILSAEQAGKAKFKSKPQFADALSTTQRSSR
jgi:hypothetical protein